mmetsp:Transcript_3920/g.4532  ORF Transcript_3920/g.4532 Transcript_3920/m.4532 type:complete len:160 (+) Transcript_3920:83-562(+)
MAPIPNFLLSLICIVFTSNFSALTAFSPLPLKVAGKTCFNHLLASSASDSEEEKEPSLLIGEGLGKELKGLKSKFPTSEVDFLAAARKRAEERKESVNSESSDDDWKAVSGLRKDETVDDWENSLSEAGNADSQILLPDLEENDEEGDGEEPEPKLLLF